MKLKKEKRPVDGFPDVKLGVQPWEICVMVGAVIVFGVIFYLTLAD